MTNQVAWAPAVWLSARSNLGEPKEGKLETARQMKADGMAVEAIAKYTGLAADEIAAL